MDLDWTGNCHLNILYFDRALNFNILLHCFVLGIEHCPLSSVGTQIKHMAMLKGSVWQIVLEEMFICGEKHSMHLEMVMWLCGREQNYSFCV
jgi:hypothetical protein